MSLDYDRMIQEQLDGMLDEARAEELFEHLEREPEAAEEAIQLETMHSLLLNAPAVRAPQHLAATIMARLSQTIEAQASMKPLPAEVRMGLMLSASLVTLVMMPNMLAATYLVLNARRDPEEITKVVAHTIMLQVMMIDALVVLLEEIEEMIERDPEMAPVAMSLIPVALQGMLNYVHENVQETDLTKE